MNVCALNLRRWIFALPMLAALFAADVHAQPNRLVNSGFDVDLTGWNRSFDRPAEWHADDAFGNASGSVRVTHDVAESGGNRNILEQCVPIEGPGGYRVSGMIRILPGSAVGNASIVAQPARNADCTGGLGNATGAAPVLGTNWQYREGDFSVSHATVEYAAIRISLGINKSQPVETPINALFDNVRLIKLADPAAPIVIFVQGFGDGIGTIESQPAGIDFPGTNHAGFPEGTWLRLTATPGDNYGFERWDGPCQHSQNFCQFYVDASTTASATFRTEQNLQIEFAGNGAGRITSTPAGADCTEGCFVRFITNTAVTLTATPAEGSTFVRWDGDPGMSCPNFTVPQCTLSMSEARRVRARFSLLPPVMHNLNVFLAGEGAGSVASAPAGIGCVPQCQAQFLAGTEVTLTATPAAGSMFAGWTRGCVAAGSTPECTLTMDQAREAQANFDIASTTLHTLDLTLLGDGAGSVTSAPAGIACPGVCSALFAEGVQVWLSAVPTAESQFDSWSGACSGNAATCNVAMDGPRSQTATFVPRAEEQRTLAVIVQGLGQVTSQPAGVACPGTCAATFAQGTSVLLVAEASPGWRLAGWSGDCNGSGPCSVPMDAGGAVTALFEIVPPDPALVYADGFE